MPRFVKDGNVEVGKHWTLGEAETGELVMQYRSDDGDYTLTITPAPRHCADEGSTEPKKVA